MAEIAAGTNDPSFDLNSDNLVNLTDRDIWLATAGEFNLGPGKSYLLGDATLDGVVDGRDFNEWNANKFTAVAAWCSADFTADGFVDGRDFNEWNAHKFQSSDGIAQIALPQLAVEQDDATLATAIIPLDVNDTRIATDLRHQPAAVLVANRVDSIFAASQREEETNKSSQRRRFDNLFVGNEPMELLT